MHKFALSQDIERLQILIEDSSTHAESYSAPYRARRNEQFAEIKNCLLVQGFQNDLKANGQQICLRLSCPAGTPHIEGSSSL